MSDFDKEAERERLREKYERDQAEREATQRMSDLLLKGARMTNTHCDVCGDPLFQQNGVTFCPNCHGSPEAVDGTAPQGQDQTPDAEQAADVDQTPDAEADPAPSDGVPVSSDADSPTAGDDRTTSPETSPTTPPGTPLESDTARSQQTTRPRDPSRGGDLEAGRTALVEALEKFASEAAATDDPRHARECLEAAREASEALAALDR